MDRAADFFVSYAGADRAWAEWIAWQLEAEGYTVVVQAWDFRPGSDFVQQMHQVVQEAKQTIAVLSPAYVTSAFGGAEWGAVFSEDPTGERGRLLPVRVEQVEPPGLLKARVYVDLVDRDVAEARAALLAAARGARGKPAEEPEFPAHLDDPVGSGAEAPQFPGEGPGRDGTSEEAAESENHWNPAIVIAGICTLVTLILAAIAIFNVRDDSSEGDVPQLTISEWEQVPINPAGVRYHFEGTVSDLGRARIRVVGPRIPTPGSTVTSQRSSPLLDYSSAWIVSPPAQVNGDRWSVTWEERTAPREHIRWYAIVYYPSCRDPGIFCSDGPHSPSVRELLERYGLNHRTFVEISEVTMPAQDSR